MNKILIVDDETKACELANRVLESNGYDVNISNSGEDALVNVKKRKPDIHSSLRRHAVKTLLTLCNSP